MSANKYKEIPAKATQTSKASTLRSTSSVAAPTKATSSTTGTTLHHQSATQDPNQAFSQQPAGRSRDTFLRGVGAWADQPGLGSEATTASVIGGDTPHRRNATEPEPQLRSRGRRDEEPTPMERFRAEGRRDQPFGVSERGKAQSERAQGKGC